MLQIVIPSRSRAGNIPVLRYIPAYLRAELKVAVPEAQLSEYQDRHPNVGIVGHPETHVGTTRQWILDNFDNKYIVMLDDDAKLFVRKEMASPKLTSILDNVSEQKAMFTAIENALEKGFAWVGISTRSGNNFVDTKHKDNTKNYGVWGVNADVLRREDIRFSRLKVMSDYLVLLDLLTRGYENRVFYKWCWDQAGSSNSPGGCSDYRTPAMLAEAAHYLAKQHPNFVKVTEKETKTGWWENNEGKRVRVDVTVQWKRAAKSANFLT